MPRSSGDASPPASTVPPQHFEDLYTTAADPWNFATSWYERRKYTITMACLPRECYDSGFEAGCSIGEMTKLLAPRCRTLLAMDCAPTAIRTASEALGEFDLTGPDLTQLLGGLIARLRSGGDFVSQPCRATVARRMALRIGAQSMTAYTQRRHPEARDLAHQARHGSSPRPDGG